MTDKIEPWMIDAMKSLHCEEYYTDAMAECDARHVAAHAPQEPIDAYCPKCDELLMLPQGTVTKEPSVPVSKLKELYNETYSFWGLEETIETIEVSELKELIHQAEKEKA